MEMNQKMQQITDPEEAKHGLLIRGSSWNKYSVKTWGKWTLNLLKQFIEPQGQYLLIWYAIFILTSVAGISVDPLMLYIPIIHKNKCLGVDRTLMILALLSRSFTDLFYVIDIIYQIRALIKTHQGHQKISENESKSEVAKENPENIKPRSTERTMTVVQTVIEKAKKVLALTQKPQFSDIMVDILAIIPLPQVIILCFFTKMKNSKYVWNKCNKRMILNILLFMQYLPRSCRIVILFVRLKSHAASRVLNAWVQGLLNLFLYLTASHVTGAFWYIFSIQRETFCWYNACQNHSGCHLSDFECQNDSKRDLIFLNDFCPINPPNSTIFDFGIFIDAVNSSTLDSIAFPTKFMRSLRWGLRNLSSFGSNLEPSIGIFETSFAASICVLGLVIFIYLIGNVQTFMQFEATRTEETRLKMKLKEEDVKSWLTSHGLKNKIVDYTNIFMPKIQFFLKKNKDVEVEQNMFNILDPKDKRSIKRHLIKFTDLKKVPLLQNVHPQILEEIIEHMEPLMYPEHSYIVHEGEPLGLMLFITQGTAWTFNSNRGSNILSSISAECLKEGSFFGAELIEWAALRFTSVFGVPISPTNVKTHKKVEALAITYEDLKKIVLKFWSKFSEQKIQNRTSSKVQQMAACVIQEAWRSHRRSVEITSCSFTINSPSRGVITVSRIQDDGNTNQEKLL